MIGKRRGLQLVALAVAVGGCQPTLHSSLPQGPQAYAALDSVRADSANTQVLLQPGDQISVRVFQEEDLTTEGAIIDPTGNVSLPLIGEIRAAGLSPAMLARNVEQAYGASFLRDPRVNVLLLKGAPRVVAVEGQVAAPGVFEVQEGYTLLTALALAGSPNETAKLDEILIFRSMNGERYGGRFDVNDIRAGRAPDPVIMSGDTIVVGYSAVRGAYADFLRTAPIIGAFSRF